MILRSFKNSEHITENRVSIEGVKKLCIDFSNNQILRYVKYHSGVMAKTPILHSSR